MIKDRIIRPILRALGYYTIKAKWRKHQMISRLMEEDVRRIEKLKTEILAINHRILPGLSEKNVTVSLTSHGKRVEQYAAFAIYSMLTQSELPNRIVLNIDQNQWTQDNLPELIKKLQVAGLEVNLCEDVGPHTKFLPTLEKYSDDIIITIDDDICYGAETLKVLLEEYRNSDWKTIICHEAAEIMRDESGYLLPYSQWKTAKIADKAQSRQYSPMGFRGVLYPPHIFSNEIFNRKVYGELCPKADDIWFTIMEERENITVKPIINDEVTYDDLDHRNEYIAENSDALHFTNNALGYNDVQLMALCKYYGL